MRKLLTAAILLVLCIGMGCQQVKLKNYLVESKEQKDARMEWWHEARFGMFIHWGLYSIPAGTWEGRKVNGIGEWVMHRAQIPVEEYEKLASHFNPVKFNADEWVKIAKEAGMKYIVITSKHHDGFGLWDSKVSDWDIADRTPYKKDILKQLAYACEREGIRLCFYHSIMDWHHPDAQGPFYPRYNDVKRSNPNFSNYVENYMKPQLKELLSGYGDIGVLWFDGEWVKDYTTQMGKDIYNFVRNLNPQILINNRVDKGRKGLEGLNREGDFAGDFGTPEQEIPATGLVGVDWESCMTMNDTWGYKSYDDNWKSSKKLIRNLVDIASKGGNFLLNVGPTAEGMIPEASIKRLAAIGEWMKINSESIYGTKASPFEQPAWGRYTQKRGQLFLHVFEWPKDGKLQITGINEKISSARIIGSSAIGYSQKDGQLILNLPGKGLDSVATVIAVTHEGELL